MAGPGPSLALLLRSCLALLLLVCAQPARVLAAQSIDDFGAVTGDASPEACASNSAAITLALAAASTGGSAEERTVLVPASHTYYVFSSNYSGLSRVVIQIDGTLVVSNNISAWPVVSESRTSVLLLVNCSDIVIQGAGEVVGQGYIWWVETFENKLKYDRPHLLEIAGGRNITLRGLRLRDSPRFHVNFRDVTLVEIAFVNITVNVVQQKALYARYNLLLSPELPVPIFPLNTDGIDFSGSHVHVHDCHVENFDDSVCVKPSNQDGNFATCSEHILVERIVQRLGVGMSIGSVPPNPSVNCVRNVTFRDVLFQQPFKAVYIKTNPGDKGTGIIANITYENMRVQAPVWWGIYIGPQQQEQPGREGPGCMLYPLKSTCPTQPRVTIDTVVLRNITVEDGLLFPGILRCNASNPCRNFLFDDVHVSNWDVDKGQGYICEHIFGAVTNSTPDPGCFQRAMERAPSAMAPHTRQRTMHVVKEREV